MLTIHPQYITDHTGKKISVVLPLKDFNAIMKELEELEDVRLYDSAKKGKQEFIAADQVFREIEQTRKNEGI